MLFKEIKNSLLSAFLLLGGTIVFLFIVHWLFGSSFFRETIKENFSLFKITENIGSLVFIFFIILAYIIFRATLEVGEKNAIEKLNKQPQFDSQAQKSLKREWLFKKIILFVVFLIIMIITFYMIFIGMPLYKKGIM